MSRVLYNLLDSIVVEIHVSMGWSKIQEDALFKVVEHARISRYVFVAHK